MEFHPNFRPSRTALPSDLLSFDDLADLEKSLDFFLLASESECDEDDSSSVESPSSSSLHGIGLFILY
uniref:Uncharacterized protein n=1 Tax=Rhizophora mucronata TaxID=61149 RepID=A0A2P2J8X7_RHIMU